MQHPPLEGIRVLEFGGYISGPYAASLLCSLGADVIKVERPFVGDEFRRGLDDGSLYFKQYNAGKRSLSVDLKQPEGVELIKDLLPTADVVLENLRPGKMDALGLGRHHLTALRPDLVYVSVTGFGNQNFNWWGVGSRSQWNITPWFYVGFDVLYQKIESASNGATVLYTAAAGTAKPTALYAIQNQDNVGFRVRLHRDIVP